MSLVAYENSDDEGSEEEVGDDNVEGVLQQATCIENIETESATQQHNDGLSLTVCHLLPLKCKTVLNHLRPKVTTIYKEKTVRGTYWDMNRVDF